MQPTSQYFISTQNENHQRVDTIKIVARLEELDITIGKPPNPSTGTVGSGLCGSVALCLEDRRFYRRIVAIGVIAVTAVELFWRGFQIWRQVKGF